MPSLIRNSIRHNWRTHLGVVLGCALASLVLVGALMVGDSVKGTLRAQAEARVGKIGEALLCGERFVPWPADKAKRPAVLARMFFPGKDAAGVLLMQGSAVRSDGKARANKVQVVGVDGDFWKLSPSGSDKADGSVALNERIAAQLSLKVGDELSVYVEKPGAFSKDAPLSGEEAALVTVKARVGRIVGDEDFGRFALTASQVPPNTVFVPLAELQAKVGLGEKVNVVLTFDDPLIYGGGEGGGGLDSLLERFGFRKVNKVSLAGTRDIREPDVIWSLRLFEKFQGVPEFKDLNKDAALRETLSYFEIRLGDLTNNLGAELRSPRIFLDAPIVAAARANESTKLPESPITAPPPGLDSLTYFVTAIEKGAASDSEPRSGGIPAAENQTRSANQGSAPPTGDQALRAKDTAAGMPPLLGSLHSQSTPYSMVTAIDAPASGFVQAELADDEIQITRWLADDLDAKPGDKLTLRYSVMGERRELIEKTRTFTVLAPIIEMEEPHLDSSWMPDFPNVPDKDSFSKWKPGFPFDSKRIRKKDEEYWEKHRGTPKAFVNLKVGQEMWGNRWGNLTSIRYPAGTKREQVERIAAFIDPKALGFRVVNLREQALAATDAPVDFGQLFASFSFFLIAAAAVLTGLLFTFTIEQRAAEAGLLLAVGWTRKKVRRLFLKEGALLALIGATVGVAGAVLYTKAVLAALAGAWSGATGGTTFLFVVNTGTIVGGILGSVLMALFAMWLASRKLFKHEASALLSGNIAEAAK
ncbi:MAG: hypothetical protein RL088_3338 [Verrucomicrobiota bacterium]|jgi:ABC-type lipoprotein release transport system permease subunit